MSGMRKLGSVDPGLRGSDTAVRENFFITQHEQIKEVIEGRIQNPRIVRVIRNGKPVYEGQKGNVDANAYIIKMAVAGKDYAVRHGLNSENPVMWRVIDLDAKSPDDYPVIRQGLTANTRDILYLRSSAPDTTASIEVW